MRAVFFGLVLGCLGALRVIAEPEDIQAAIDRQLQAFQADDFEGAFTFASPNLQQLFQTPQNFERMVTQGYPMVWKFNAFRFLELREEDGAFWQRVLITDTKGVEHVLEHRMLLTEKGWRINGVQILDSAAMSA